MYIYRHKYIHTYMHTLELCMYIRMYVIRLCLYIYMYTYYIYACIYVNTYIHTYTYIRIYIHTYIHTFELCLASHCVRQKFWKFSILVYFIQILFFPYRSQHFNIHPPEILKIQHPGIFPTDFFLFVSDRNSKKSPPSTLK
jgi:hypothetical protein